MIISLMDKKTISSLVLPEKIRGKYSIKTSEGTEIEIEGVDEKWFIKPNKKIKNLNANKYSALGCEIKTMEIYNYELVKSGELFILFAEPSTDDRVEFKKYLIRNDIKIRIGRKSTNDIVIDHKYVSSSHATLIMEKNTWKVIDNGSSNGTFVNGKRIEQCNLKYGDVIYIMGIMIIIGNRMFAINNPDQIVKMNNVSFLSFLPQIFEEDDNEFELDMVENATFYRSPRFKRDVETATFKIDSPPANQMGEEMPMMMAIGPSMTMGMASMATAIYGVAQGNMMSAVTSGCMLAGTVLWPIISKRYEKKRKIERENLRQKTYREYLDSKE